MDWLSMDWVSTDEFLKSDASCKAPDRTLANYHSRSKLHFYGKIWKVAQDRSSRSMVAWAGSS